MTGDFVLSVSSQMLAKIRNEEVVVILSKVLEDLVRGMPLEVLSHKTTEKPAF